MTSLRSSLQTLNDQRSAGVEKKPLRARGELVHWRTSGKAKATGALLVVNNQWRLAQRVYTPGGSVHASSGVQGRPIGFPAAVGANPSAGFPPDSPALFEHPAVRLWPLPRRSHPPGTLSLSRVSRDNGGLVGMAGALKSLRGRSPAVRRSTAPVSGARDSATSPRWHAQFVVIRHKFWCTFEHARAFVPGDAPTPQAIPPVTRPLCW